MKKVFLLENDDWFWEGLEDWCKSFDPEFQVFRTSYRDWMLNNDYHAVGMLSQPFVDKLLVSSSFEGEVYTTHRKDPYPQVAHFLEIIEAAFHVRNKLGYEPFEIHINYHGVDFAREVMEENWGWDFSASLKRFVRQNPGTLKICVYNEYKLQYQLTEELFDSLIKKDE